MPYPYNERLFVFPQNLELLGPALPPGWQRPTRGLIQEVLTELSEGIAPPSAPHLYMSAHPITWELLQNRQVIRGIELLRAYCDPDSPSELKAAGMAYPQLAQAAEGSFRLLAINVGMPDVKSENRQSTVQVFCNPIITPIVSEGWEYKRESCFPAPGIAVVVKRWKAVTVQEEFGGRPVRLVGTDAWLIQHEGDHLDGVVCVMRALEEGSKLYYLPPEAMKAARTFFGDLSEGPPEGEWPEFPVEHWQAMVGGDFAYEAYVPYLG